jgi:hypothetical protein
LPQTPIEVGIEEAFNWLKLNGRIQIPAGTARLKTLSRIRGVMEGVTNAIAKRPVL